MADFFAFNWLILVVTALILIVGKIAEDKQSFVSNMLNIEMKSFYFIIGGLGAILAVVNFIALEFFGSWKMMFLFAAIAVAIFYIVIFLLKKRKE